MPRLRRPMPILGVPGPDGIGRMVWSGKMPVEGTPVVTPQSSDDFAEAALPLEVTLTSGASNMLDVNVAANPGAGTGQLWNSSNIVLVA